MPNSLRSSLRLCVADLVLSVTTEDDMTFGCDAAAERFLVDEDVADVRLTARWGDLSAPFEGQRTFDSGGLWTLYEDGGAQLFRFHSPSVGPHPYKTMRIDAEKRVGEMVFHRPYYPPGKPVHPFEYPLDELLMMGLLADGRGVELHGCGVVDPGGAGLLFLGMSGAGKSTMGELWQRHAGAAVLSDDRIILRRDAGGLRMFGTPWHGEADLALPQSARLDGIFLLRHAPSYELSRIDGALATARLFARAFPPFHSRAGVGFTLDFLGSVAASVAVHELGFLPRPSVIDVLRRALA